MHRWQYGLASSHFSPRHDGVGSAASPRVLGRWNYGTLTRRILDDCQQPATEGPLEKDADSLASLAARSRFVVVDLLAVGL